MNPYRYCGEYFDTETGFTYLRARYYDAKIGRFISEDPALDGLNWYAYCGNDPVNKIDPSGNIAVAIPIAEFLVKVGIIIVIGKEAYDAVTGQKIKNMESYINSKSVKKKVKTKSKVTYLSFEQVMLSKVKSKSKGTGKIKSKTTKKFWKSYRKLPKNIQKTADDKFRLFQKNPNHRSLNFEKLIGFSNKFSVRINDMYRAIGDLKDGVITWTEIIPHTYNKLK